MSFLALCQCQCDRHPGYPCTTAATQEDFRCDACRPCPGVTCVAVIAPEGKPHEAYAAGGHFSLGGFVFRSFGFEIPLDPPGSGV